jgi:hypothetical protein
MGHSLGVDPGDCLGRQIVLKWLMNSEPAGLGSTDVLGPGLMCRLGPLQVPRIRSRMPDGDGADPFAFLLLICALSFSGGWLPRWERVSSIGHADRDRELRVPTSEPGKPRGIVPRRNWSICRLH